METWYYTLIAIFVENFSLTALFPDPLSDSLAPSENTTIQRRREQRLQAKETEAWTCAHRKHRSESEAKGQDHDVQVALPVDRKAMKMQI